MHLEPFERIENAIDAALKEKGANASIIAMPYGGSTLPVMC